MWVCGQEPLLAGLLCAVPLCCLGVCVGAQARAGSVPRELPAAGTGAPGKAAAKGAKAPMTLRFVSLDRISGEDPQLPAALLQRYRGETVQATYQVCIGSNGSVLSVRRTSGITEADPIIVHTLRAWRYPPQPPNTMTCLHEVFEFSQ